MKHTQFKYKWYSIYHDTRIIADYNSHKTQRSTQRFKTKSSNTKSKKIESSNAQSKKPKVVLIVENTFVVNKSEEQWFNFFIYIASTLLINSKFGKLISSSSWISPHHL